VNWLKFESLFSSDAQRTDVTFPARHLVVLRPLDKMPLLEAAVQEHFECEALCHPRAASSTMLSANAPLPFLTR